MMHGDLLNRWHNYSFNFQMANVSTDVMRAIKWKQHGDLESSRQAYERALELLSFTIIDKKHPIHRRRELCRAREVLNDYFYGSNIYKSTDQLWENYFTPFEYLASLERKNILDQRKKI